MDRLTDHLDMTIVVVDWDIKHDSNKQSNTTKSATRRAQLVPIGIPTICLYHFVPTLI